MDDNKVVCNRCGASWVVNQAKRNRTDLKCFSCRMRPASSIQYGKERCVPWQGDFDREDNPMLNGEPFMPGVRICGHRDCCNGNHLALSAD